LNMEVFGESLLSIRFWSMLFASGIILLIFFFQQKKTAGLMSSIIMASIPVFYFYSRQAQYDIIVTFFILLGIFFWKAYDDGKKPKFLYLTGVAFGLAMMSKVIVGAFLPMSIFLYGIILVARKEKSLKQVFRELFIVMVIGLAISMPWMIYMYIKHGNDFINHYFIYHIFSRILIGVEANDKPLGLFFFLNQLFVIMSGTAVFIFFREKKIFSDKNDILLFSATIIPLIVFSLSKTKLHTYFIILLPYLSLLAGKGLDIAQKKNKLPYYIVLCSLIFSLWSFSQGLRNNFKEIFTQHLFNLNSLILISIFILIAVILFIIRNRNYGKIFVTFLLAFMVLLFIINPRKEYYISNIKTISKLFEKSNIKHLFYIDSMNKSDVINPQISYYFSGIDLGWRKDKTFNFINLDSNYEVQGISFPDSSFIIIADYQIIRNKTAFQLYQRLNLETKMILRDSTYICYEK
jgi:4-amino-4-deoxy-L-arabinose transferase-like glycosyltransferase